MLRYGCTRLEIGVQSVYEDVARDTNRGHTVRAVSESFHMAKDAGFKVVAHMMPDLPNVGIERDMEQFKVCRLRYTLLIGWLLTATLRNTSRTRRSGRTGSRYTQPLSFVGQGYTSCGGQGDTRITRRMSWWMWSLGYWPWSRHGREFIVYSGKLALKFRA